MKRSVNFAHEYTKKTKCTQELTHGQQYSWMQLLRCQQTIVGSPLSTTRCTESEVVHTRNRPPAVDSASGLVRPTEGMPEPRTRTSLTRAIECDILGCMYSAGCVLGCYQEFRCRNPPRSCIVEHGRVVICAVCFHGSKVPKTYKVIIRYDGAHRTQ